MRPDAVLIPDSRSRHAQAQENRLLEQSMSYLSTIQRRTMKEKKDDLDALIVALTRLATSITQVVRLSHQLRRDEGHTDGTLETALRLAGLAEPGTGKEETP